DQGRADDRRRRLLLLFLLALLLLGRLRRALLRLLALLLLGRHGVSACRARGRPDGECDGQRADSDQRRNRKWPSPHLKILSVVVPEPQTGGEPTSARRTDKGVLARWSVAPGSGSACAFGRMRGTAGDVQISRKASAFRKQEHSGV